MADPTDPPRDETTGQALVHLASRQGDLIEQLIVSVTALTIYVSRQPGFDRAAFRTMEEACRIALSRRAADGQPLSVELLIEALRRDLGDPQ
jgi:hypothetical protein